MQTKYKQMELTNEQINQFNQLKDTGKLHKLQAKCDDVKKELENLITERSECLSKREKYMKNLTTLQGELNIVVNDELRWQEKLEAVNTSFRDYPNDHLQSICLSLGYQINKCQLLENNGLQVTLHYRDVCYVTYSEVSKMFDLVEICPRHPNFELIRQFLLNSQDLKGLLSCIRKFFDFAIEFKETKK